MLILAGVSLNALVGDNGIITNATYASILSRFSTYKEELDMNAFDNTGIYASGEKIKNYISNIENQDIDKFVIMKSQLLYIGSDNLEKKAVVNLGLNGGLGDASNQENAVKEIQAIIGGVIELGNVYTIPSDDSIVSSNVSNTEDGLIGTRLYDRNSYNINNKTWNILDEYDTSNTKIARYGSGYYWLEKGKKYIIENEELEFKNDYVVNYSKNEYVVLSDRAVNWNEQSTIAVSDGLVLNVDPVSLANGDWINTSTGKSYEVELKEASEIEDEDTRTTETNKVKNENFYNFFVTNPITSITTDTGVQKIGDVVYNESARALKFNDDPSNIDGEGGYLKYSIDNDSNINFSNGFCYEIYMNLTRGRYVKPEQPASYGANMGFFVKISSLNNYYANAMRFGAAANPEITVCRLSGAGGTQRLYGEKMTNAGSNISIRDLGYDINENVYLTFNYKIYDENASDEFKEKEYDNEMIENNLDRIEYYINGNLYGYTYNEHQYYESGRVSWDNSSSPFYLGVCPFQATGNLYYLKGQVFSTRIYNKSMTSEEVKANYETTLKYRSSFSD